MCNVSMAFFCLLSLDLGRHSKYFPVWGVVISQGRIQDLFPGGEGIRWHRVPSAKSANLQENLKYGVR